MSESADWDWQRMWNAVAFGRDPYDQMGRTGWTLPHFVTLVAQIARQAELGPTSRVLDAGGGAGWVAASLSPFVQNIVVVDYAKAQAARAAAAVGTGVFPNMAVRHGDVRALDALPDAEFDRVLCVGVLQYFDGWDDVRAALKALRRVTEPGGLVLIGHNPTSSKREGWVAAHAAGWDDNRRALEDHRLWFEPGQLEGYCTEAGFVGAHQVPIHPMLPGAEFMTSLMVRADRP